MKHKEKDPVCGMAISVQDDTLRSVWQETTYYFCASACKEKFDADPEQYAQPRECCGKHQHPGHRNHGECSH
ncbi:YHS domain-containing protein [Paenibacillus sp. BR2-3]|uniref:YHS domain-containing protein n=1 Tax=Paenibacillus sp. BR2-3 TaxID=3048494 RepID=UPI003977C35A